MGSRKASVDANNWCNFITTSTDDDIDIDNDGIMSDTRILVDLSQMLSQRLGKQLSMMSTYTVEYISIHLVNVDDGVDNTDAAEFGGRIHWWSPSKHRIDAMQLARQIEGNTEKADIDANSWLISTVPSYRGMRFEWDADGQINSATGEPFGALGGSKWDLAELFSTYADMQVDRMETAANRLWPDRLGYTNQMAFSTSYQNASQGGANYLPRSTPFEFENSKGIDVLGGLLMIDIESSSTDTPSVVDDDYQILVTVGVTGWSDF